MPRHGRRGEVGPRRAGVLKVGAHLPTSLLVLDDVGRLRDRLDARLVGFRGDAEEAVFAPVRAPTVLDPPVLLPGLLTPTDEQHSVVHALPILGAGGDQGLAGIRRLVDALGVEHEVLGRLQPHNKGPVAVQLLLDRLHTRVAIPSPDIAVGVRAEALALQGLEIALQLARAARVVAHARRRQQADVPAPLRGQEAITALATLVVLGAKEGEVDGPGQRLGVVLADLVAGGEHAHGRCRVAAAAVGLVHHGFQEVLAVLVRPVELLRQRQRLLQEAARRRLRLERVLLEHLAVHLPRAVVALDPGVRVDLAHGSAIPLWHGPGAPAELKHCQLLVQLPDDFLLRLRRHRLPVVLGSLPLRHRGGRRRGGGRRVWRGALADPRAVVAAELRAVLVLVPAHHRVPTMRDVVGLLQRVRGVDLEGKVGEGEEVEAADDDLKALVVDHRPMAAHVARCLGDVRAPQSDHELLCGGGVDDGARRLPLLGVRPQVPARGPLLRHLPEGEAPLAEDLVVDTMHREVSGARHGKRHHGDGAQPRHPC
mmetsp:Transcript_116382/g.336161  ORF Transcript_116382/g.336161 Transcript_116382/m.336161 type:complete len:539 (+) Transcript_116382:97-1713(+)